MGKRRLQNLVILAGADAPPRWIEEVLIEVVLKQS
jgi:hypothetical protein